MHEVKKQQDQANFADNLRYLCGFYGSISEVCRQLEINRQQFNRYINGSAFPAFRNLKRICDFFGVETEEIVLAPKEFQRQVVPVRPESSGPVVPEHLARMIMPLMQSSTTAMERYEGYYYRYFYSFGFPGYIFRSFIRIYRYQDGWYIKHIERTSGRDPVLGARMTIKYQGMAFLLSDRLFIVESEPALNSTISETILTPSYRPNNPWLSGLMICASSCSSHQPGAARTVFEYLGKDIDVRKAMRQCDLFHHSDERIPRNVKQAINNTISPEEFTFHPPRS